MPPSARREQPRSVSHAAVFLVGLNAATFVALLVLMRGNGLMRDERNVYASGRTDVAAAREPSVFLQDEFEVPPGLQAQTTTWQGYIEIPTGGGYAFSAVTWGSFDLRIGNRAVLSNPPELTADRRSIRADADLERGIQPFRLVYNAPISSQAKPGDRAPRLMQLYWTVPGGGEYQHAIGRSWFYPTRPGRVRRAIALLWRVKMGLPVVSILALWWLWIHAELRARPMRKTEESQVA